MVDKCPKCGETLITRSIQKKLGLGSIELPVARICPKCNWSKDLTGAGDIVAKPPATGVTEAGMGKKSEGAPVKPVHSPEKARPLQERQGKAQEKPKSEPGQPKPQAAETAPSSPDMNRIITIVLALLVIAGIIWTFLPKGEVTPKDSMPESTPTTTPAPALAATAIETVKATPETTPSGTHIKVNIDRDRGYYVPAQKDLIIKPGDDVVWENVGSYPLTFISRDGLFDDKFLDYKKISNYTFKKTGTFVFDIKVNDVKKFNGTVTVQP